MTALALLGAGGHASDVLAVIEAMAARGNRIDLVYLADDQWPRRDRFESRAIEVKMVESIEAGAKLAPFVIAVGYPTGRHEIHRRAIAAGGEPAGPLVHPDSCLGTNISLAPGVVVMGRTWLSPGVAVAQHTHISYGVTVGHDTQIGAFSSVMPCACIGGDVAIHDRALIGANATVLQGRTVHSGATVGAGAVVTHNVPAATVVIGVPARHEVTQTDVDSNAGSHS